MSSELIETTREKAQLQARNGSVVHHQVVIVGGGTAGITVAARLTKGWFNETDVAIIDPSDSHYYQPAWTLVGAGTFRKEATRRDEASVIPPKATWIQDAVVEFEPKQNRVKTRDGRTIEYDFLVVCAGIQINWDAIKGLKERMESAVITLLKVSAAPGITFEISKGEPPSSHSPSPGLNVGGRRRRSVIWPMTIFANRGYVKKVT
nr:FAD-dependent oxidoreductase [uncultured Gimesia sp.]